ncbi:MAG: hypothetical protein ACKO2C_07075 [Actinomycetes bacterium]
MSTQLRLIDGGRSGRHLDAETRRIGRRGVEEARATLARIQPPPATGRRYPKAG